MGAGLSVSLVLDKRMIDLAKDPGAAVQGKLVITNKGKKPIKLRNPGRVQVKGRVKTMLFNYKREQISEDTEDFWSVGGLADKECNILVPKGTAIPPGVNEYPFSYEIPKSSPSSSFCWDCRNFYGGVEYIVKAGAPPMTKDVLDRVTIKGLRTNKPPDDDDAKNVAALGAYGLGLNSTCISRIITLTLLDKQKLEKSGELEHIKMEFFFIASADGKQDVKKIGGSKVTGSQLGTLKQGAPIAGFAVPNGLPGSFVGMVKSFATQYVVRIRIAFKEETKHFKSIRKSHQIKRDKPIFQTIHVQRVDGPVLQEPKPVLGAGGGAGAAVSFASILASFP